MKKAPKRTVKKTVIIPKVEMVKREPSIPVEEKRDPRPSFSVNEDLLPALKNWATGKTYKLEIEVEQTGSEISDWGDDKGKLVGRFKINQISVEEPEEEGEYPKAMRVTKK